MAFQNSSMARMAGAQMRLELGEGHFDRIEVGAVGRQKHEPGASVANGLFGGRTFVSGQIVQDDDVALLQGWDELGAHVGLEDRPVRRRVDDPWRGQAPQAVR